MTAALAHRTELPVLGIPVRFETDSDAIMAVVTDTFGVWRAARQSGGTHETTKVHVRLMSHEGPEGEPHAPVTYHMPDRQRLLLRTPGSVGHADLARHDAVAYVTPALVADREHFRYSVVEALTYFVLSDLDRCPFHAAALVRGARALLLAGPSGVGKSTVTYAASRRGFRVLAEDIVWLAFKPRFRIWGLARRVNLPKDAARMFRELADARASLLANGKEKIALPLETTGGAEQLLADGGAICLLSRSGGPAGLVEVGSDEIERALLARVEAGFDRYRDAIPAAVAALAARGGWRLNLSDDPTDALPHLEEMLTALDQGA